MNKIRLSIIIVNYNSKELINNCLTSINKFNDIGDSLEIIIVDNSEKMDDYNWLSNNVRNITDLKCTVLKNVNNGFGGGNNLGAKHATGDVLLFLNPDTIMVEPIFNYVINVLDNYLDIGVLGVQLVDSDGRKNSSYGLRMPLGMIRTLFCRILIKANVFIQSIMYTSGADLFIRKNDFFTIGMFDENIFMYCEEADICNRLNMINKKIYFEKTKHIVHLEGKTQDSDLYTTYLKQMESRKYYCQKYSIDFVKFVKKEKRYCTLKRLFFEMLNNSTREQEYKRIEKYLDQLVVND